MHGRRNDQRHVWLLSGTGEGPALAAALVSQGWRVSVSVVTVGAAAAYADLPLENLWTGPLAGVQGIRGVIEQAYFRDHGFDWVVDATHPFAVQISLFLKIAPMVNWALLFQMMGSYGLSIIISMNVLAGKG